MVARACELLVCLLIGSNIFSRGEFWGNAQPLYLTRELRSMSKLFGLFQVLFVFSLFLHTQAQYFMSLNWNNLYYHTGKCANYEFTCSNQVEIETNIESFFFAFSLYLYIFLYLIINRIINNNNYNIDRIGRIRLVLTYVSTDNVVCFSSVSISVFLKLLSCLLLLLFLFFQLQMQ